MENEIRCFIKLVSLKDALNILKSIYDEYDPKPLFDSIVSPYSLENETHFRINVTDSYAEGAKLTCKVCKSNNIEKSLMRLHVAKHILSGLKSNGKYKAQSIVHIEKVLV